MEGNHASRMRPGPVPSRFTPLGPFRDASETICLVSLTSRREQGIMGEFSSRSILNVSGLEMKFGLEFGVVRSDERHFGANIAAAILEPPPPPLLLINPPRVAEYRYCT
jgi:hypothetical protein